MSNLEVIEKLTNELGSEYHLSHYVDNMTDGFFDWRIQEDYEYMSPKFWKIFGYKPEEKEHKPSSWIDLINKEDFEKAQKKLNQHIKSKGKEPYITVICRGKIIEWDGDVPLRMIGTHTDITGL
jgi:PAS domain S-box-containing protein